MAHVCATMQPSAQRIAGAPSRHALIGATSGCPRGLQVPRAAARAQAPGGSMLRSTGVAALLRTPAALGSAWARSAQGVRCFAVAAPAVTAPSFTPVKEAHGFVLERQEYIKEYDSHTLVYKHQKTGAEVISVVNSDENKTFGVVFRTPVDDSTGIPHILEHSVLCGSRKYPIKEPFVELMKGSLNTFLNAFTYPDRTCYPVASTNKQDFYNLVDVYLDAVFFPRCISEPKVFQQEGWHLELEDPKEDMVYKGVVYNEMKGVYSSPDSVYYKAVQEALFPDNSYRHDSGGDPVHIPSLTFEQFKDFHSRYYHPSNARFWFHGDDEPTQRLKILDEYLSQFEAKKVLSAVKTQPLIHTPRKVVAHYAAGQEDAKKAFVGVNWVLTDENLDVETQLALGFLDYLMMGTNAAPLRKALNDSGLGAAVLGGGIDDELKQPTFSVGLKGVDPAAQEAVADLVLTKLQAIKDEGFTPGAIEAAVNSLEFSLRENNTGSFPRGLSLMLRAMGSWIYDRDPLEPLKWEDALTSFKAKLASGEDVFGPLIQKFLLDNKHRVTVVLLPDTTLGERQVAEEKARLQKARQAMTPNQEEGVIEDTRALKELQETPDPPEALACVPSLQLSDLEKNITKVPTAVSSLGSATLLTHELFTNDVLYLEAALDMKAIPAHLLPLVPLFSRSLLNMATKTESFIELTERIGRKTGGLSVYTYTSPVKGKPADPVAKLMFRGKAMKDKAADLLALVHDLLLTSKLDDRTRFKQMVDETKSGLESAIVSRGHSFANLRLAAQRGRAGWLSEQMGGLSYLEYVRGLAKRVESDWDGVRADLEAIRTALLSRPGALINMTGDAATLEAARPAVESFLSALPDVVVPGVSWDAPLLPSVNEALAVPTQVNYVAKAGNLYEDAGYELQGSAYVVEKYLGTTHLWDKVRVVGGAYGGFCSFDSHSGNFSYMSYRDPNLLETVEAYDASPAFLKALELSPDEVTKAVIGTIGDLDGYQLPDAKGYAAMSRYLLGITDEERQVRRDQILGTTVKDFHAFGEALEAVAAKGRVAAVTSAERAEAVLKAQPGYWDVRKVL